MRLWGFAIVLGCILLGGCQGRPFPNLDQSDQDLGHQIQQLGDWAGSNGAPHWNGSVEPKLALLALRFQLYAPTDSVKLDLALRHFVFDTLGWKVLEGDSTASPAVVLAGGAGDCASLAALIAALGERVHVRYRVLELPGHVVLKGPSGINLETRHAGLARSDSFYQTHFAVSVASLVPKPPEFLLADLLVNAGADLASRGHWEEAETAWTQALRLNPNQAEARRNQIRLHQQ